MISYVHFTLHHLNANPEFKNNHKQGETVEMQNGVCFISLPTDADEKAAFSKSTAGTKCAKTGVDKKIQVEFVMCAAILSYPAMTQL